MLFSFLLSLFFEMSQLTGLFGLYSKPYRIFSVDDLILNTLGGLIGFVVYTKCLRFLPRLEKVDQKIRRRGESVSFTRRLVALLIDSAVVGILQDLVSEFLKIDPVYVFGITLCAYTIIISLVSNGRTIGKALVRIKVSKMSTGLPFVIAIILRYLLRNAAITGIVFSNSTISVSDDQRVWLAIFAGISFFSVIDLLYSLRKGKRLWYDRISRTENVSTIKPRRIS